LQIEDFRLLISYVASDEFTNLKGPHKAFCADRDPLLPHDSTDGRISDHLPPVASVSHFRRGKLSFGMSRPFIG
jgi:hypothetical protein